MDTNQTAQCFRCGQHHPQRPTNAPYVEVNSLRWTGGYESTFPGDLAQLVIPLCEFCFMAFCAQLSVPPLAGEASLSGSWIGELPVNERVAIEGLCLAREDAALLIATATKPGVTRHHAHLARYLAHRRDYGDPNPGRTQRVAAALSATLDAEGSEWRTSEAITDAHLGLCAFGIPVDAARVLRDRVREIAAGSEAA